jgi:hypothetical protein
VSARTGWQAREERRARIKADIEAEKRTRDESAPINRDAIVYGDANDRYGRADLVDVHYTRRVSTTRWSGKVKVFG